MKTNKAKKATNSSFITNHDLIEGIRNKSLVATKENSTRVHTNKSKVSLLRKKSYERFHTNQENHSMVSNVEVSAFAPSLVDKAIMLLQDCVSSLGEGQQKIIHKLKKVLAYVREMQDQRNREDQSRKIAETQRENALLYKLEQSCQEKAVLKRQNDEYKLKLSEYIEKLQQVKKQPSRNTTIITQKTPSNLQQIIINQSEIINKQCEQIEQQKYELRQLLHVQALQLQDLIKQKNPSSKRATTTITSNHYSSMNSSFSNPR